MWLRYILLILLLVPPVLQSWLAVLMWRRGSHKRFRVFFVYTLFAVAAEVTKFSLLQPGKNTWPHFWASWGSQAIYAVLGFLAIREVFRHVFENFNRLPWFRFLLPAVGLVMLSISVLIPIIHPAVDTEPAMASLFALETAVRCLQLGVFFLIFFLARVFDLDYRQYDFGIAAGFGVAAAGILVGTLVRTGGGLKFLIFFQIVPSVAYCTAVSVWLVSFIRPEPDDPFRDFRHLFTPELFLKQLERYKQEVRGVFRP